MSAGHSEYADGKRIEVGDSVLIEHGRTPGTVELLVSTDAEMAAIGVSEPGIMLFSPPFGRVYLPARSLIEDPLEFVSRVTRTQPGIDFPRGSPAIATRELVGERKDRERFAITIRICVPYQVNDVSWACPVALDGVDTRLADMHGIDSWQALLLAISLVRSRLEHFLETGGKLYWPEEPSSEITLRDIFGNNA
jgi:hypothetical protein